ncbi:hypothetical protein T492DRAFT_850408 [Pavlovales sp. CCMP2436]|nr:hypothetical protein T492DRAFT_850408 [Pavlovales sp. CCMP2436]
MTACWPSARGGGHPLALSLLLACAVLACPTVATRAPLGRGATRAGRARGARMAAERLPGSQNPGRWPAVAAETGGKLNMKKLLTWEESRPVLAAVRHSAVEQFALKFKTCHSFEAFICFICYVEPLIALAIVRWQKDNGLKGKMAYIVARAKGYRIKGIQEKGKRGIEPGSPSDCARLTYLVRFDQPKLALSLHGTNPKTGIWLESSSAPEIATSWWPPRRASACQLEVQADHAERADQARLSATSGRPAPAHASPWRALLWSDQRDSPSQNLYDTRFETL